jgi:hypothetical protein
VTGPDELVPGAQAIGERSARQRRLVLPAQIFEEARVQLDQMWRDTLVNVDMPGERLVRARRFVRSYLLGMLVRRQLPSEELEPQQELALLCLATLQTLVAPES